MKLAGCLLIVALLTFSLCGIALAAPLSQVPVTDLTHRMTPEAYASFANTARLSLQRVAEYWNVDLNAALSEPISIEFMASSGHLPTSLFFFRAENNKKVKVVRVIGAAESPRQFAHKLTSALFPHQDKLIRNMMGEVAERDLGNRASFPACSKSADEWVAVLINTGSYIPLSQIGTDHADWGMAIINNLPVIRDRKRQHVRYAEAGSFGQYLVDRFGKTKMIEFYWQAKNPSHRPWQEVFGLPLEELEQQWLAQVNQRAAASPETIATLASIWRSNPQTACYQAQNSER